LLKGDLHRGQQACQTAPISPIRGEIVRRLPPAAESTGRRPGTVAGERSVRPDGPSAHFGATSKTIGVSELPNTGFGGFHVSPDGRWLIVHAPLAEPGDDICAFSISNDATPVAGVLLTGDLSRIGPACPGEIDLLELLASWGPCAGCTGDLDGSGVVGVPDLLERLAAWWPCV